MNKYKVLLPFIDIYTKVKYKADQVIELTNERAIEITGNLGDGYIKLLKKESKK